MSNQFQNPKVKRFHYHWCRPFPLSFGIPLAFESWHLSLFNWFSVLIFLLTNKGRSEGKGSRFRKVLFYIVILYPPGIPDGSKGKNPSFFTPWMGGTKECPPVAKRSRSQPCRFPLALRTSHLSGSISSKEWFPKIYGDRLWTGGDLDRTVVRKYA